MFKQSLTFGTFTLALALALSGPAHAQGPIGAGGEILTRGPVHEAFAEPVIYNPAAGPIVPQAPPGPIEELPPDQRPAGDNVEWMPGYWQWDEERQDYLWVSGIWRVMPPGRQWVPGYWQNTRQGYQWVSGYWAPIEQRNVEYLSPPPPSLEVGPNVPPPALQGFVWTPGHWFWTQDRYVWRPGMWVRTYPDWIWVPATYAYSPAGSIFVPGYWDHAIANRGMIFAPVYFAQPVYTQPAFVYTPAISISVALLTSQFFARPSCGHYYFGDYYANNYRTAGYEPWFALERSRVAYDPIYAWSAATNAPRDVAWSSTIRETYRYRVENVSARPERTFAAQERMLAQRQDAGRDLVLARTLAQEARVENATLRLQRIDQTRRIEFAQRERTLGEMRALRSRHEGAEHARMTLNTVASAPVDHAPRRFELPRSPIAAPPHFPGGGEEAFGVNVNAEHRQQQDAARSALNTQRTLQAGRIQETEQAKAAANVQRIQDQQQRQELLRHEHSAALTERFHQQEQRKAVEAARDTRAVQQRQELSQHEHAVRAGLRAGSVSAPMPGQVPQPTPLPPHANPAHTHLPQTPPPPPPHHHPGQPLEHKVIVPHEHEK